MPPRTTMTPKLYRWMERALSFFDGPERAITAKAVSPYLITSSAPIRVETVATEESVESDTFIVPANHHCTIHYGSARVAILTLNTSSDEAGLLLQEYAHALSESGVAYDFNSSTIRTTLLAIDEQNMPFEFATLELLRLIYGNQITLPKQDKRIAKSIAHMIRHPADEISIKEIAQSVHLSPTRFMALFQEIVGISFNKFKMINRFLYFLEIAQEKENFTHAASEAGYHDLSHLNKTIRAFMGMCPKEFFEASENVKMYYDSRHDRSWYADWIEFGSNELYANQKKMPLDEFLLRIISFQP